MRCLSQVIAFFIFSALFTLAQSPHGTGLKADCSDCHTSTSWNKLLEPVKFDHNSTAFPLAGQHKSVDCRQCHTELVFDKAGTDCFSCHKDIHSGTVGKDCSQCHTPQSWLVTDIKGLHEKTRFPLLGAHQDADCGQCHTAYASLQFEVMQAECFTCHKQDFLSSNNPNHTTAGFSTECTQCHAVTDRSWQGGSFSHEFFPLLGGHNLPNCFSCHNSGGFTGLSSDCKTCHLDNYNATTNPNHTASGFSTDCKSCHSIYGWSPANFDHNLTDFPLTGRHTTVSCNSCHTSGYANTPTDCNSCHNDNYLSTTNPNHVSAGFPLDCSQCHTTNGWQPAQFDHDGPYFPIYSGQHRNEWNSCSDCHTQPSDFAVFSCVTCHEHNRNDMDQEHGGIQGYIYSSDACLSCHPNGNADGAFNHGTSLFPLTGSHITAPCAGCHTSGYAQPPSTSCQQCHQNKLQTVFNPDHQAAGLTAECSDCHTTSQWKPSLYDHTVTGFTLTGAHTSEDCNSCHATGYTNSVSACNSCHLADFNSASDPNHIAANFPQQCETCHTTTGWSPASFDHDAEYFPIYSGNHGNEWNQCSDCHTNSSNYAVFTCVSCHEHNRTDMDNEHQGVSGYIYISSECFACHPDGSSEGAFNHANSNFPLTGTHITLSCSQCHASGYASTPADCNSCHNTDYSGALNPNHQSAGIPVTCQNCHDAAAWVPSSFTHTSTQFPLTGAHVGRQCSDCHSGSLTAASEQCASCHQADYNAAVNPDHQTPGIPVLCETCHSTTAWIPSSFSHATTLFPLTGAHTGRQCSDCHSGSLTAASVLCFSCHQPDFSSTANPDHEVLALSTACETCHTTNAGWSPALFPDHDNYFPLIGRHNQIRNNCTTCHNGNFTQTPNTCYGCHQNDFTGAQNPNHVGAGYPHDCETCHSQTAWEPSTFNHDAQYFPIYSGKHRNKWNQCSQCHQSSSNFAIFTCISCHEHNQPEMDNEHQGVNNYQYNSAACFNCHPDGDSKLRLNDMKKVF